MANTETSKLRRRVDRSETAAIGMGLLLLKLRSQFGDQFGHGIAEQVDQAIRDYRQLERERMARQAASDLNSETAARSS